MQATVLIVTQANPEAFRLTVDSFRRHNPGFPIWAWLNDVDADTKAYAAQNCERVFYKTEPLGHLHAQPLDKMVQEVRTPFVCTLDDDVLSHGPAVGQMIGELERAGDLAVAASFPASENMGSVNHHDRVLLHGQPRIDPCFAVYRTGPIARMTRHVSFSPYECCNLGKFYDTGSILRSALEGAGYRILELPWLRERATHFGSLTWAGFSPPGSSTHAIYTDRMQRMREAARKFYTSTQRDKEVVVAKYKEDVSWTKDLPYKVTVYDKSGEPIPGAIPLPNVGREAETWAAHVAENYDNLRDVVVFAQGRPFDHVPDFTDVIRESVIHFRAYGKHTLESFAEGDCNHPGLPLGKLFRGLTNRDMPAKVLFTPGAMFAATKETLRRYPQTWWRRLADKLAAPETATWGAWTMERLWRELLVGEGMPHFYDHICGWLDFQDLYSQVVAEAKDGDHFVECGTFHGKSAAYMAVEIINSAKQIRFDVVDTFRGGDDPSEQFMRDDAAANGGTFRPVFEKNVEPVRHVINVLEMDSVSAAATYPDESLSFIFLDAAHDQASVAADIAAWLPKLRPNGLLAGHDYSGAWPGVIAAVDEAFGDKVEKVSAQCWAWRKPL